MSEIAGDAFFFSLFYREHNHAPYSGGVNTPPILMDPINALRLELSKNKISGI